MKKGIIFVIAVVAVCVACVLFVSGLFVTHNNGSSTDIMETVEN
jgi:hypothetical protein